MGAKNRNPAKGGSQPAHKDNQQAGRPVRARHSGRQIDRRGHQNDSYNNGQKENDRFGGNLSHNDIILLQKSSPPYCCLLSKSDSILTGLS